jgi:hypothetical protein
MPHMRASQKRMNWRCASNSEKDEDMQRLWRQFLVCLGIGTDLCPSKK